jgi:hypothetical protein
MPRESPDARLHSDSEAPFFAITLPAEQIQWSGWVYFWMIILVPLRDHYLKRRIREGCGMRISESGERKWGKTNQEARRTGRKLTDQA